MIVIDRGHEYAMRRYDGPGWEYLRFLKREGPGFPGNVGHYSGTNCQEVLRVLIDRVKYLDKQVPCSENAMILSNLRHALLFFEKRAADRHGLRLMYGNGNIEDELTCSQCGHIVCEHENKARGL